MRNRSLAHPGSLIVVKDTKNASIRSQAGSGFNSGHPRIENLGDLTKNR
jgi:hypothetical protein